MGLLSSLALWPSSRGSSERTYIKEKAWERHEGKDVLYLCIILSRGCKKPKDVEQVVGCLLLLSSVVSTSLVDPHHRVDHTKDANHLRGPSRVRETEEDGKLKICKIPHDCEAQVEELLVDRCKLLADFAYRGILHNKTPDFWSCVDCLGLQRFLLLQQLIVGAGIIKQID